MPTVTLMSSSGKKVGEVELSGKVFEAERNIPLIHQAVLEELNNMRSGTVDTKTRGEVAGGGRKPYRQKGTGRARQGSTRAPHYPGGGVVWGPHQRDYDHRMPRRMKRAALLSALSAKLADGEVLVIDDLKLDAISTKTMAALLDKLGATGKVLLAVAEVTDELVKSSRNIPGVVLRVPPALSVAEVVDSELIVFTKAAAQKLEEAFSK